MKEAAVSEARRRAVRIGAGGRSLAAELLVPMRAHGLVVLAYRQTVPGSANPIAETLHAAKIATLDLDLGEQLASPERASRAVVTSLADQVLAAADWVAAQPDLARLPLGVFGSETGGGVALAAAARRPGLFRAVVSTMGRPDLASGLDDMHSATLLIVAGHDDPALLENQEAMARVRGIAELEILPGLPDSRSDDGSAAHVARLARRWFVRFLS